MRDFARAFYSSGAWKRCRAAYAKSVGGLCEVCLRRGLYQPGVIVHHKIFITPENVGQPDVVLNWDNLELVCRDCHAQLHEDGGKRRYTVDEFGHVTAL